MNWQPKIFFKNGSPTTTMGLGITQSMNKSTLFGDQSSSSRVERLKNEALLSYKLSQPKSGPVKNETEKNSRNDALTRVRAGGYVPPAVTKILR